MEKKLYAGQKHNIAEMQRILGLGHYTLYRYVGNEDKIKKMPIELLEEIGKLEKIKPLKLREEMLEYARNGGEEE